MDSEPRTLVVVGEGIANGTPDQCLVSLAFNAMADSPAIALNQVADVAKQAVGILRERGVEAVDIQTTSISVQDFFDKDERRVTARVASYSMTVRTRSIEDTGPLLAAVTEVAGDSLQVHGINLEATDAKELEETARRGAVADAISRAHQIAEAAGLRLGPILAITEGREPTGRQTYGATFSRAMAASGESMPIEPGQVTRRVAVTVTYAIED